ncbi:MAG: TetR/AcrR family transcriptional regulator [Chloroflexota bacterium]
MVIINSTERSVEYNGAGAMSKRSAERKDQLMEVATRLFREKGYHNTSMQDLADALGVQKSSLYYHVDSKEELLLRILELSSQLQQARIDEIYAANLSPIEKLRCVLTDHTLLVTEYQDLFSVYINEFQSLPSEQTGELKMARDHYQRVITKIVEDGINAGCFRSTNAKVACLGLLGMLTWIHRWYSPEGELSPQEIAAIMVDLALYGLAGYSEVGAA